MVNLLRRRPEKDVISAEVKTVLSLECSLLGLNICKIYLVAVLVLRLLQRPCLYITHTNVSYLQAKRLSLRSRRAPAYAA